MARTREKTQGRKDLSGGFAGVPRIVMDHTSYKSLSGGAVKMLLELCRQYKGKNNGDLTAAFSVLKQQGFNSKDTIRRAIAELIDANLIIEVREGRFTNPGGRCALYAITWQPVNECLGKCLSIGPTQTAPRKFSMERIKTPEPKTGLGSDQKQARQRRRNAIGRYLSDQKQVRLRAVT